MNCTAEMLRLYAVTDRAWVGRQTLPQQVEAALKGGATCVQLREKHLDDTDMLAEAKTISALCRAYHVPFILNDNVPLAKLCGADGVHVGQDDLSAAEARRLLGPDKIIGVPSMTNPISSRFMTMSRRAFSPKSNGPMSKYPACSWVLVVGMVFSSVLNRKNSHSGPTSNVYPISSACCTARFST